MTFLLVSIHLDEIWELRLAQAILQAQLCDRILISDEHRDILRINRGRDRSFQELAEQQRPRFFFVLV